jgi:hypothetical protein
MSVVTVVVTQVLFQSLPHAWAAATRPKARMRDWKFFMLTRTTVCFCNESGLMKVEGTRRFVGIVG